MTNPENRIWRLTSRPSGNAKPSNFTWSTEPLGDLAEGQVRVRTAYLSLDPTNRIWASDAVQYMPPVQLGEIMRGATVGVVEQSRNAALAVGDLVSGLWGWQGYYQGPAQGLSRLPPGTSPLVAMSVLGFIGLTAYFGLLDVGKPKAGETVVVSAAAGAVGSLVGQIAKIHGCRVVGITSTEEKCRHVVDELGFDAAVSHREADLEGALRKACPAGIDVNFENVGGRVLEACLANMNRFGRVSLCGLISGYNQLGDTTPPGPANFQLVMMKRLTVQGFIIFDYFPRMMEALPHLGRWLAEGKLKFRTDVVEGLENAPAALDRLFTGANIGKLLVKVSDL
jgi:NADPH-dependent curcumin reductase CurA